MNATEHWTRLARHSPLGLLVDLDGTLVPLAETPDLARPAQGLVDLVDALAARPGVSLAIVSGRPRSELERFFGGTRSLWLAAEHGAFLRDDGVWRSPLKASGLGLDDLQGALEDLARRNQGALVERKSLSLAFHYRRVSRRLTSALRVEVESLAQEWMRTHPGYECLRGSEVVEMRPTGARKSAAVPWVRERAGHDARLVAIGDDITDEDMFAALGAADEGILVAGAARHPDSRALAAPEPRPGGALP